jgi:hypothetical protein
MIWIIVFGTLFSIIVILFFVSLQNYELFIINQSVFSGRGILWANSIHIS